MYIEIDLYNFCFQKEVNDITLEELRLGNHVPCRLFLIARAENNFLK